MACQRPATSRTQANPPLFHSKRSLDLWIAHYYWPVRLWLTSPATLTLYDGLATTQLPFPQRSAPDRSG